MTEHRRPRLSIPSRLLHGHLRTSTLALCLLWLGLWMVYLFLNQEPEPEGGVPQQAVIISDQPYVPYVPPVEQETTQAPVPTTEQYPTESTTVPTTGVPVPTDDATAPGVVPQTVPTNTVPTTTGGQAPFQLPRIPGLTNFDEEPTTEPTGGSGS